MRFSEGSLFPNSTSKLLFPVGEKAVPPKQLFVVYTRVCFVGNPEENGTT